MSYDLYFKGRRSPIPREDFVSWFEARDWYSVEAGTEGHGANYENELTRVNFGFGWLPRECLLSVNLLRPTFFAVEASWEIEPFVEAFDLRVSTNDDGPWEAFDADSFVTAWGDANIAAIDMLRRDNPDAFEAFEIVDTDLVARTWHWNARLEDAMEAYVDDFPRATISPLKLFRVDDRLEILMTWPFEAAIAVPDVATGVVLAEAGTGAGQDDTVFRFVTRAQIDRLAEDVGRRLDGIPAFVLPPLRGEAGNSRHERFIEMAPMMEEFSLEAVPFDCVLEREVVEED